MEFCSADKPIEKNKKFKNKNLFDYLKNILSDKNYDLYNTHILDDSFKSDFKKLMELRYLSMSTNKQIQKFIIENQFIMEHMDEKVLYKFLIDNIPRQYNYFIKYLK